MLSIDTMKETLDHLSVPMLVADKAGCIVHANLEFNQMFGYDEGELDAKNIEVLVPRKLRKTHKDYASAFMRVPAKRGMGRGRTLLGVTKSGEEIPVELALNSLAVDGRKYSLVAAVDVRVRLGHQRKMELAMEATATAMAMVDESGTIVLINEASLKLSGYDRDELLGNSVEYLVNDRDRAAHRVYRANFGVSSDQRRMSVGRMVHLKHKSGKSIPVEITLTPVSTPEGNMVMSTMTDLTERIAAESAIRAKNQELGDANWRLAEANKELTQFAYAVSHDLKAPLSSLQGLMQLIREDLEDRNFDEVLDNVDRSLAICHRSRRKVERILKMARDTEERPTSHVRLDDLMNGLWNAITPGAEVAAEMQQNLGVDEILTSQDDLEIVLHNLLSNAVKYHDPEKDGVKVAVTSKDTEDGVEIRVIDNGVGIPTDQQEEIFKMFRRFDKRSGDGIGLALVQKHMGRLGGKITLKSEPGQGTTFQLMLPQNGENIAWK